MDNLLDDFFKNLETEPSDWDNEFYVSISRASDLSGLSESQIRYLENFPRIPLGKKEGLGGRNRVYTKRDVRLLKWIALHNEIRPATIAQFLETHQEVIFEKLGHITLKQTLQREQALAGRDTLISHLVTLLVSILQEAVAVQNMKIEGVVLGPPDESWKTASIQSIHNKGDLNLANCFVIWSDQEQDVPSNFKIFFSHQPWYLSFSEKPLYTAESFPERNQAFTIIIFWRYSDRKITIEKQEETSPIKLSKSRRLLAAMVMHSLSRLLNADASSSGEPVSVYSRSAMGVQAFSHGLSLLLEYCIKPYFPNCDAYVGKFEENDRLEILKSSKNINGGYLSSHLGNSSILNSHEMPWWIEFARERASIALDQDVTRRPERREGYGSVVCIPLIESTRVVGVLEIESTPTSHGNHCLVERDGISSKTLLCYLICIAEIAADYLNLQLSFLERTERSRLTYASTQDDTITWYLNIYRQGGLNYTEVIKQIITWTKQINIEDRDEVNVAVIDIVKEGELAEKHKGFNIILKVLEETKKKIESIIKDDPIAEQLESEKHLVLFGPVTDHFVLVTINEPKEYLHVVLERIRNIWREESGNTFTWENRKVPVSLQVGVCIFENLRSYNENMQTEIMKHHLWGLAQQLANREPLDRILEYKAVVPTTKVEE